MDGHIFIFQVKPHQH